MIRFLGLGAAALFCAASAPAAAATVVTASCVSVTDAAGCLFNGNINGNADAKNANSFLNAQNAYNLIRDDIALSFITQTDNGNFATFGSFTGAGTASGTWTLAGWDVSHIAVKASNQFVLYAVDGSTGSWDTLDIPYLNKKGKGNPHAISHLAFFGVRAPVVPEPATWALLILGFGAIGGLMRRGRAAPALRPA